MPSKKGSPQEKSGIAELYGENKSTYHREYVKNRYYIPSIHFAKEHEEAIRETAKSKGMSVSEFINWCVLQHIGD